MFSVAGDLDPEAMVAAVRKYVGHAAAGREFDHNLPPEPPVLSPRTVVATFPKLGQAKLEIAFPSVKLDNPDLFAFDLLSTALAAGDSSILVEELRDKRRLVSAVSTTNNTPAYVDGTFEVDMELDPDKIKEATTRRSRYWKKVKPKA